MLPGADLGTGLLDCSMEEDEEAQQLRALEQTSLKLKDNPPASVSQILELQAYTYTPKDESKFS